MQVPGLVNVDFADVRAIMTGAGSSLMGQGRASGKARARDAALAAISSPLLDVGIERATGIVWNITGPADLTLFEVSVKMGCQQVLEDPVCTVACMPPLPEHGTYLSVSMSSPWLMHQEKLFALNALDI